MANSENKKQSSSNKEDLNSTKSSNVKNKSDQVEKNLTSYDEVKYDSRIFGDTTPNNLGAIAKLFGINVEDISKARVLEIGGGNCINSILLATINPDAKFVGIDLAKTQIDNGKELVKKLGLKNVDLHHMSISDMDESLGQFDYIICHGVYSWVPEDVRSKILDVSSKLLSENGVAYVSYNISPGWNMAKTVRDMMIFHTKDLDSYQQKVHQARAVLNFVYEAVKDQDTPYAKMLKIEVELMSKHTDSYIYHDYMSSENYRPYFYEFIAEASKHNLQYLANSDLATMTPINFGENIAKALAQIENDLVRQEQYVDFIANTRFRRTLLCRKDTLINRTIDGSAIDGLYILVKVSCDVDVTDEILRSNQTVTFSIGNQRNISVLTMSTPDPHLKACLQAMRKYNTIFTIEEVYKEAKNIYPDFNKTIADNHLRLLMLRSIFSGAAMIFLTRPYVVHARIPEKPKLWKFALFQIQNNFYIMNKQLATQLSFTFDIDDFQRVLLTFLDGTNDVESLKEKMKQKFSDGTLKATQQDGKSYDPKVLDTLISQNIELSLMSYNEFGLLE